MDSPDMEVDDDTYEPGEPAKNTKSPGKKDNLNDSKTENTVSIKMYYVFLYVPKIDPII